MTTQPIVPNVLGLRAEKAVRRDVEALSRLLDALDDSDWTRDVPHGDSTVLDLVQHLSRGADRLGSAWADRRDPAEAPGALQHPVHDPQTTAGDRASDPDAARSAYGKATHLLLEALGTCRSDDWSWPVWSPLGGTEPLAGAVRRWLAHHRIHHVDVATAVDRSVGSDPDTETLVTEFVLDAVARRGGSHVTPPLHVEVIVDPPGSGTWTLIVDESVEHEELPSLWREIMSRQEERDRHRLERGSAGDARLVVRTDGETLWRAAFNRGASWSDVQLHGDDDARSLFGDMTAALTTSEGAARIQT